SQDEPPTLIGSEPAPPPRPPTLTTPGTGPVASSASAPADAVSAPGPEEVGEGDVVRVNTTLVTVPVSVLDRQGRFVPNLRREDFTVFENGSEQSIAYFEPAEKPFTVALLLDTSPSTHFHLWEIKEAAIAFAKQLRPQDRVLIVSFNDEVLLLTEATNDVNLIETIIEENVNTGNSTRLYDAVDLTVKELLNKIKGRKAIVLITAGQITICTPSPTRPADGYMKPTTPVNWRRRSAESPRSCAANTHLATIPRRRTWMATSATKSKSACINQTWR